MPEIPQNVSSGTIGGNPGVSEGNSQTEQQGAPVVGSNLVAPAPQKKNYWPYIGIGIAVLVLGYLAYKYFKKD